MERPRRRGFGRAARKPAAVAVLGPAERRDRDPVLDGLSIARAASSRLMDFLAAEDFPEPDVDGFSGLSVSELVTSFT